ncbi:MAG: ribulose-phosphate 3-epimerase [Psittacicella sp.]
MKIINKKFLIAPSILSANLADLGNDINKVLDAGGDVIHFDVMDNHYVPNLTFGAPICKALRDFGITAPIDVHIMAEPVDSLIEQFGKSGATSISIHPETTKHLDRSIELIKSFGCHAGIVLNPATPLNILDYILDKVDIVLVMSVNPGFGGQSFIPHTLEKIKSIKELINKKNLSVRIEVDGGIKVSNIAAIAEAGADMFVSGSGIFSTPNYKETIDNMRSELSKVQ